MHRPSASQHVPSGNYTEDSFFFFFFFSIFTCATFWLRRIFPSIHINFLSLYTLSEIDRVLY